MMSSAGIGFGCWVGRPGISDRLSAKVITPKQENGLPRNAGGKLADADPRAGQPCDRSQINKSGHFNTVLEGRLRERGFLLEAAGGSGVLAVAYTLDAIKDEPGVWYLNVKASDGFSFSRVYSLGPETKPDGGMVQTTSPEKGSIGLRESPGGQGAPAIVSCKTRKYHVRQQPQRIHAAGSRRSVRGQDEQEAAPPGPHCRSHPGGGS